MVLSREMNETIGCIPQIWRKVRVMVITLNKDEFGKANWM